MGGDACVGGEPCQVQTTTVTCDEFLACICGEQPAEGATAECLGITEVIESQRAQFGTEAADRYCNQLMLTQPVAAAACGIDTRSSNPPECDDLVLCQCADLEPSDDDSEDCRATRRSAQSIAFDPAAQARQCATARGFMSCAVSRTLRDCLPTPRPDGSLHYYCAGGCEPVEAIAAPCGGTLKCLPAAGESSGRCVPADGTVQLGESCLTTIDCAGQAACKQGICRAFCRTDEDCAEGSECTDLDYRAGNGDPVGSCKEKPKDMPPLTTNEACAAQQAFVDAFRQDLASDLDAARVCSASTECLDYRGASITCGEDTYFLGDFPIARASQEAFDAAVESLAVSACADAPGPATCSGIFLRKTTGCSAEGLCVFNYSQF